MENQTYEDFVTSRVKWMGELPADMVHATIGISGELVELTNASDRTNLLEELGDLEFYCVHLELAFAKYGVSLIVDSKRAPDSTSGLVELLSECMLFAGELLDCAKKAWIYRKPIPEMLTHIRLNYLELRNNLEAIHSLLATSPSVLRANNEAKLRTRYPVGYSDAYAQLRLDK